MFFYIYIKRLDRGNCNNVGVILLKLKREVGQDREKISRSKNKPDLFSMKFASWESNLKLTAYKAGVLPSKLTRLVKGILSSTQRSH
jgi:hypothetical protein